MTRAPAFYDAFRLGDGRLVRRLAFVPKSALELDLLCRVANAAVDRLRALFAAPLTIELLEPVVFERSMHARLLENARVVRVRGSAADAFVVLRARDARRLADSAFAQTTVENGDRLSVLESRLVERLLHAVAGACAPLCGQPAAVVADSPARVAADAMTYFEMRIAQPLRAAIGIALTAEPHLRAADRLETADIGDLRVGVRAILGRGALTLERLAALSPGDIVRLETALDDTGRLEVDGRVVARGHCGVDGGHFAFVVTQAAGASP